MDFSGINLNSQFKITVTFTTKATINTEDGFFNLIQKDIIVKFKQPTTTSFGSKINTKSSSLSSSNETNLNNTIEYCPLNYTKLLTISEFEKFNNNTTLLREDYKNKKVNLLILDSNKNIVIDCLKNDISEISSDTIDKYGYCYFFPRNNLQQDYDLTNIIYVTPKQNLVDNVFYIHSYYTTNTLIKVTSVIKEIKLIDSMLLLDSSKTPDILRCSLEGVRKKDIVSFNDQSSNILFVNKGKSYLFYVSNEINDVIDDTLGLLNYELSIFYYDNDKNKIILDYYSNNNVTINSFVKNEEFINDDDYVYVKDGRQFFNIYIPNISQQLYISISGVRNSKNQVINNIYFETIYTLIELPNDNYLVYKDSKDDNLEYQIENQLGIFIDGLKEDDIDYVYSNSNNYIYLITPESLNNFNSNNYKIDIGYESYIDDKFNCYVSNLNKIEYCLSSDISNSSLGTIVKTGEIIINVNKLRNYVNVSYSGEYNGDVSNLINYIKEKYYFSSTELKVYEYKWTSPEEIKSNINISFMSSINEFKNTLGRKIGYSYYTSPKNKIYKNKPEFLTRSEIVPNSLYVNELNGDFYYGTSSNGLKYVISNDLFTYDEYKHCNSKRRFKNDLIYNWDFTNTDFDKVNFPEKINCFNLYHNKLNNQYTLFFGTDDGLWAFFNIDIYGKERSLDVPAYKVFLPSSEDNSFEDEIIGLFTSENTNDLFVLSKDSVYVLIEKDLNNYCGVNDYLWQDKFKQLVSSKLGNLYNTDYTYHIDDLVQFSSFAEYSISEEYLDIDKQSKTKIYKNEIREEYKISTRGFICVYLGENESIKTFSVAYNFDYNNDEYYKIDNNYDITTIDSGLVAISGLNIPSIKKDDNYYSEYFSQIREVDNVWSNLGLEQGLDVSIKGVGDITYRNPSFIVGADIKNQPGINSKLITLETNKKNDVTNIHGYDIQNYLTDTNSLFTEDYRKPCLNPLTGFVPYYRYTDDDFYWDYTNINSYNKTTIKVPLFIKDNKYIVAWENGNYNGNFDFFIKEVNNHIANNNVFLIHEPYLLAYKVYKLEIFKYNYEEKYVLVNIYHENTFNIYRGNNTQEKYFKGKNHWIENTDIDVPVYIVELIHTDEILSLEEEVEIPNMFIPGFSFYNSIDGQSPIELSYDSNNIILSSFQPYYYKIVLYSWNDSIPYLNMRCSKEQPNICYTDMYCGNLITTVSRILDNMLGQDISGDFDKTNSLRYKHEDAQDYLKIVEYISYKKNYINTNIGSLEEYPLSIPIEYENIANDYFLDLETFYVGLIDSELSSMISLAISNNKNDNISSLVNPWYYLLWYISRDSGSGIFLSTELVYDNFVTWVNDVGNVNHLQGIEASEIISKLDEDIILFEKYCNVKDDF